MGYWYFVCRQPGCGFRDENMPVPSPGNPVTNAILFILFLPITLPFWLLGQVTGQAGIKCPSCGGRTPTSECERTDKCLWP